MYKNSHPRLASQYGASGWKHSCTKRLAIPRGWFDPTLQTLKTSLGSAILLTLLVPVAWRDPLYRKMAIVAGFCLLGLSVETFHLEHYTAPAWAALAVMIAVWAEHAWDLQIRRRPVGVAPVLWLSPHLLSFPSLFNSL